MGESAEESATGVRVERLHVPGGCGAAAAARIGDRLSMLYKGSLPNGTVFIASTSNPGARPMTFTLGKHEVLRGWEDGSVGMCVGERRRVTIPPALGFGARDTPIGPGRWIPANSTLVFEVELVELQGPQGAASASNARNATDATAGGDDDGGLDMRAMFDSMDADKNGRLSREELLAHMLTIDFMTEHGMRKHTRAEVEQMYEEHHGAQAAHRDRDGDGELSWEEWDPQNSWGA
eukprot:g5982.t1